MLLNEGTSILASFCVSVRQMEGKHESPIQSLYGLKTLFCVSDTIVQSLSACQNMYYTCWNEHMKRFSFLEMLDMLLHVHEVNGLYQSITTWCTGLCIEEAQVVHQLFLEQTIHSTCDSKSEILWIRLCIILSLKLLSEKWKCANPNVLKKNTS